MSDLTEVVPYAVFGASVLGSAHCAGMCGGLALSRSNTVREMLGYHFGRLGGYLVLGAAAGFVGERVFSPSVAIWLSWIASVSMAALFFGLAYRTWHGRAPHFRWLPAPLYSRLFQRREAFLTGVFTSALPCGWLQSFVIGSIATRSPAKGAFFLFVFWLGTLPVLVSLPVLSRTVLLPIAKYAPRIAALLLVAAGVGSLALRASHATWSIEPGMKGTGHSCGHDGSK